VAFFTYRRNYSKTNIEHKDPQIYKKRSIIKTNKSGDHILPNVKTYYKDTVVKTVWY
jgi:hypothetical protein